MKNRNALLIYFAILIPSILALIFFPAQAHEFTEKFRNPIFILLLIVFFGLIISGILARNILIRKKQRNILDEKCNPLAYIEALEQTEPKTGPQKLFYNYDISTGLFALGRYDDAIMALREVIDRITGNKTADVSSKPDEPTLLIANRKVIDIVCHVNLMNCYIRKSDFENAKYEYENYLKDSRLKTTNINLINSIDSTVLLYQFLSNKTTETAREYLEELNKIEKTNKKKMPKYGKLFMLYSKATAELEIGDTKSALEKFKIVAEQGNKLWIAKLSRDKVEELSKL